MGAGKGTGLSFGQTRGSLFEQFIRLGGRAGEKAFEQFTLFDEPTAIVWSFIEATQPNYPGTEIPRSFIIDTPNGKFWTHGNATKHMSEIVTTIRGNMRMIQSNPKLLAQFILYDYWKSLTQATGNSHRKKTAAEQGHWEFSFSKQEKDEYPIVKHAVFKGFN